MANNIIEKTKNDSGWWNGTRNTSFTTNGNIYGVVESGICIVAGWIKLSDNSISKGSIIASNFPACSRINTNILGYDQNNKTICAFYMDVNLNQTCLYSQYDLSSNKGHIINLIGTYPVA